ncbi:hypothetical protein GCM10020220_025580 [Nonomuraea rubra]
MTAPHTNTTTTAEPRLPDAGAVPSTAEPRPPGVGAVPGDTEAQLSAATRSDEAEERWISAHLFHFGDLDPLITAVVDPVTRELTADGTARTASSCATGRAASTYGSGWRCRTRPGSHTSAP